MELFRLSLWSYGDKTAPDFCPGSVALRINYFGDIPAYSSAQPSQRLERGEYGQVEWKQKIIGQAEVKAEAEMRIVITGIENFVGGVFLHHVFPPEAPCQPNKDPAD